MYGCLKYWWVLFEIVMNRFLFSDGSKIYVFILSMLNGEVIEYGNDSQSYVNIGRFIKCNRVSNDSFNGGDSD